MNGFPFHTPIRPALFFRGWLAAMATLLAVHCASAQGIRGKIISSDGAPLSFATIFIHETGSGTSANGEGRYEIALEPGTYRLDFRHLGYKPVPETITVTDEWLERDVVLQPQTYTLLGGEVHPGDEDPAYTIMRKAIAKSAYFRNQLDGYTCKVYVKGSGKLNDYPWIARPLVKEEGIDTAVAYTVESITEVTYTRPNKYEQKVLHVRSTGTEAETSYMDYIATSFYSEHVAGILSPLSKKAFAFYKFRYLGTYREGDHQVEKIQVIPRLKGESFFSGDLHIVDGLWNIHSLDFKTTVESIELKAVQTFAPVAENVWLPISHRYFGTAKIMGFEFEFNYIAAVSDYEVRLNQDLNHDLTVLDEKKLDEVDRVPSPTATPIPEKEGPINYDTLTTRQLRKALAEYAKEERMKKDEPLLIGESNTTVDSAAATIDSEFWDKVRPVPLTTAEVKGYQLEDSLARVRGELPDTVTNRKFKFEQIFFGGTHHFGYGHSVKIYNPLTTIHFNTVDGFNWQYRVEYQKLFSPNKTFTIGPTFRYAHSRDKGTGFITSTYSTGNALNRTTLTASGGTHYRQFNRSEPISAFTNTISSLFVEKNYMKIYDRAFGEIKAERQFGPRIKAGLGAEYNHREQTYNTTDYAWIDSKSGEYKPNIPRSIELPDPSFGKNDAFLTEATITYFPNGRYYRSNNRPYLVPGRTSFTLLYRKGIPDVGNATTDFDFLSLEAKHTFTLGIFGELNLRTEAGKFLTSKELPFMDYAHFTGNQTIFTRFKYMNSYSIMPYYDFSTAEEYVSSYLDLKMNRFVFSSIPALRKTGLTEHILFNHLVTPHVDHYTELGYSVGNIFRLFRIDVTAGLLDGKYHDFRIQLGITSNLFQPQD